jgi:CDP-glycerol glycerophosphotransferase
MKNKLIIRIQQIQLLFKIYLGKCISVFFRYRKEKPIWLVLERGNDARDNGFALFEYLNNQRINQDIDIIYIISKKSTDYSKVKSIGKVVEYGSIKHYVLLNYADIIASTHFLTYIPKYYMLKRLIDNNMIKYKAKTIFLQHGIIKDYLPQLFYPNIKFNLFICGAKPEYEYVIKEFNHPDGVVQYTGLPRFDKLHNFTTKKEILLMPTWRMYLDEVNEKEFINSEYYRRYQAILDNESIINYLKQNNYTLVFYPHYEIQKFIHLFKSNDPVIKIASFNNYDVQTLLKESSLLITDYSSVYFDFAYMNKPVIYYQFDSEDFIEGHYKKGYFNYETMGFGKVTYSEHELIQTIENILKSNCKLEEIYEIRIKEFFHINDKRNCERVYNLIKEL